MEITNVHDGNNMMHLVMCTVLSILMRTVTCKSGHASAVLHFPGFELRQC